jgi:hypothetical protein
VTLHTKVTRAPKGCSAQGTMLERYRVQVWSVAVKNVNQPCRTRRGGAGTLSQGLPGAATRHCVELRPADARPGPCPRVFGLDIGLGPVLGRTDPSPQSLAVSFLVTNRSGHGEVGQGPEPCD